jgi:hypothetical protein
LTGLCFSFWTIVSISGLGHHIYSQAGYKKDLFFSIAPLLCFLLGVIAQVAAACVDGASILEICVNGDKAIEEGVKTVYTKGKINKGKYIDTLIRWTIARKRPRISR